MEDGGVETSRVVGCGCGGIGGWGEEPADGPVEASRKSDEFVGGELLDASPVDGAFDSGVARSRPANAEERFERWGLSDSLCNRS